MPDGAMICCVTCALELLTEAMCGKRTLEIWKWRMVVAALTYSATRKARMRKGARN